MPRAEIKGFLQQTWTHSPLCPESALSISCGCSSCHRALTGLRWPAAAQSYTRPGPQAWLCSSQCHRRHHHHHPRCHPLSSSSQHGSYCGPILQHQEYVRLLSYITDKDISKGNQCCSTPEIHLYFLTFTNEHPHIVCTCKWWRPSSLRKHTCLRWSSSLLKNFNLVKYK